MAQSKPGRPKRAVRSAQNKARWAMLDELRRQAFAAARGEPVPDGVSPEAWELLRGGATATPPDLRWTDAFNAGFVRSLDAFLPPRKDGTGEPEDQD